MIDRVVLLILDSLGVGQMPDASGFDDEGANTLVHLYQERGELKIPNLCSLGIGQLADVGCAVKNISGCFCKMAEKSLNKDTTTGHWELTGVVMDAPFPTYPDGFPAPIIKEFEKKIGKKILGNYSRSGTEILKELGAVHMKTGYPIVYTSADSVFQIAAHEDIIPTDTLYEYCRAARGILINEHAVGRVIARPFNGTPQHFVRINTLRKDFSLTPPEPTLLDRLKMADFFTAGIGKIGDIFGHKGLTEERHTESNSDGVVKTLNAMDRYKGGRGLIFVNLVDFDMVYGHRRDVEGYARALEEFDQLLPDIIRALTSTDVLIITADHGCDPAHQKHTDHTREYVPLLVYGDAIKKNIDLGIRDTFADCGQTIADIFGINPLKNGKSFKGDIING